MQNVRIHTTTTLDVAPPVLPTREFMRKGCMERGSTHGRALCELEPLGGAAMYTRSLIYRLIASRVRAMLACEIRYKG